MLKPMNYFVWLLLMHNFLDSDEFYFTYLSSPMCTHSECVVSPFIFFVFLLIGTKYCLFQQLRNKRWSLPELLEVKMRRWVTYQLRFCCGISVFTLMKLFLQWSEADIWIGIVSCIEKASLCAVLGCFYSFTLFF